MRLAAWTSIAIGAAMFAQWSVFIANGQVPELQSEPVRIAFHLGAEAVTALALIVAGAGLLRGLRGAVPLGLVASGMLAYTAIVSPGYFAQQGEWPMVAMFAVVLALAVMLSVAYGRVREAKPRPGSEGRDAPQRAS